MKKMFYKLLYFKTSDKGICADDFKRVPEYININPNFILSVSDPIKFRLPLSGTYVNTYGLVIMSNNDRYYIVEQELKLLKKALKII